MGFLDILEKTGIIEMEKTPNPTSVPNNQSPLPTQIPNNYFQDNKGVVNQMPTSFTGGNISQPISDDSSIKLKEKLVYFRELLNEANLPGPDIKEVLDSLEQFNSIPGDEKYKMIYSILSTTGLTQAKIDESYKVYMDKINSADIAFDKAINDKTDVEINKAGQRSLDIDKEIESYKTRILSLENEKIELSNKISTSSQKIAISKSTFKQAKEMYVNLLTTTYQKLKEIK